MHIFLSGPSGVGKSTVIRRVLARLNVNVGGFCSGYGEDRQNPNRLLCLWDAGGEPVFGEERAVARVVNDRPRAIPGRFDTLGCAALTRAREEGVSLLVMDECGRLERNEVKFRAAVLACLDGNIPVLGVVGRGEDEWLTAIRTHPKVTVLEVTEANRDGLPEQILKGCANYDLI